MLNKKVYSAWAFKENEGEKAAINREIYKEIRDKAKVKFIKNGYSNAIYEIIDNPENLSNDELALICDRGNLCFGYRIENKKFIIYTD